VNWREGYGSIDNDNGDLMMMMMVMMMMMIVDGDNCDRA
jgi:hypothetical protein